MKSNTFLPGGAALKFFSTSGLPQRDLKKVWGLSDTVAPKGKLSKPEFFRACKFVAIRQSGGELAPASLESGVPLPKLGSRA